jgi:hypothetical protein
MESKEPTLTSIRDERAYSAIKQLGPPSAHLPPSKLPHTSAARLSSSSEEKTILYLAYGSNLSAEAFRGRRGVRPLSSVNVLVPSLFLTFDLAGLPYLEPCFANTAYRTPPPGQEPFPRDPRYRKNHWQKGLVGVLYEVTPEDYRTIIATEGGGASYQEVVVPCYPLEDGISCTPEESKGEPVLGRTLLSPRDGERHVRPDPAYAQPSFRYLKLLKDGAEEHGLPRDYMEYLASLHGFKVTTWRQVIGRALFVGAWMPCMITIMGLGRVLADKRGRVPEWFAKLTGKMFSSMWVTYDGVFRPIWGDGERTIGDIEEVPEKGEIYLP